MDIFGAKWAWRKSAEAGVKLTPQGQGGKPVRKVEIAFEKGEVGKKVVELSEDLKGWLGKDYRKIVNDSGDLVLLSKDGTRKLRFDIKNPHPHTNPHSHIAVLKNGKWENVKWEGKAQLYPRDVPKY